MNIQNIQEIMQLVKAIKNPQEYVLNNLGTNPNPMFQNLIDMAKKGDTKGVEQFARNMFKEQGKDFDQIMSIFK